MSGVEDTDGPDGVLALSAVVDDVDDGSDDVPAFDEEGSELAAPVPIHKIFKCGHFDSLLQIVDAHFLLGQSVTQIFANKSALSIAAVFICFTLLCAE